MRLPVAAKMALISAGAIGGTPGLADAAERHVEAMRHDVHVRLARRLVDAHHLVVVEVALLHPAVLERDFVLQGDAQAP